MDPFDGPPDEAKAVMGGLDTAVHIYLTDRSGFGHDFVCEILGFWAELESAKTASLLFVKGMVDTFYMSMTIVQKQENELRVFLVHAVCSCRVKGASLRVEIGRILKDEIA